MKITEQNGVKIATESFGADTISSQAVMDGMEVDIDATQDKLYRLWVQGKKDPLETILTVNVTKTGDYVEET